MSVKVALTPAAIPGGGGGHVVRCLALARAMERRGAVCTFVVEPTGVELLARLGWTGAVERFTDLAERRAAIHALAADRVVVDDYRLDAGFEAGLPGQVLAIDDLADRPHAAAWLVDSAPGRAPSDYQRLAPGARLLLGPEFALLREGFAGPERPVPAAVSRVFVCFGLSDVGSIAARALALLRPLAPEARFDVAVAADAPSVARLKTLAETDPGVTLHIDADVAPLMRAADLGVGAGGGMVWERRGAGLPQLVVTLADNQRPMSAKLAADGVIAAVDLDDPAFEPKLRTAFTALLAEAPRRAQLANPIARCDGRGADRVAEIVLGNTSIF